ncbi:Endonuclease/exonuclease/phosphatase [Canna indica]|uniref:Endonuclease/exonuclease/phosphatase n=1 Tax=Canna indica TaxID=4628 RepID=A0AAQ3KXZ1_9LILI|nr:Endonuclease/exonuclease/phosphatase [Canna indica]
MQEEPSDPPDPTAQIQFKEIAAPSRVILAESWPGKGNLKVNPNEKGASNQISGSNLRRNYQPGSWAGLFNMTRKEEEWRRSTELSEKIMKIQSNAKGRVNISDLMKARYDNKLFLYGKFFARTSNFELVKSVMLKLWKIKSECQIVDLAGRFFLFKFNNERNLWKVLAEGPWFLRGQTLSVMSWKENFQPLKEVVSVIPTWIQFPGLPYEYMHKDIILRIAATVEKPVKLDEHTLAGAKKEGDCTEEKFLKPEDTESSEVHMVTKDLVFLSEKEVEISKAEKINEKKKKDNPLEEMSKKLSASLSKIMENKFAKDFLEEGIDPESSRNFEGRHWDGDAVASVGKAGGIMVLWRKSSCSGKIIFKDDQSINCLFEMDSNKIFLLSYLYASNNIRKRSFLWKILEELNIKEIPWMIAGDMNCILNRDEKRKGRPFVANFAVTEFCRFINKTGLLDAGFVGPSFTWTNKRKEMKKISARLDRVLFNANWLE